MSKELGMRIGITGSSGFIGWHLRCLLHEKQEIQLAEANEAEFENLEWLNSFVSGCDSIFHLAGMNRGPDDDVYNTNVRLAELLVKACRNTGAKPHVVFSNSVQINKDNPYGKGKKRAAELLREWADQSGAAFSNCILPNLFGESGRPFYNSVVATFCHQLAIGEKPTIIEDNEIALLHVRDAVETMVDAMVKKNESISPKGRVFKVSTLLQKLEEINAVYRSGIIPDLTDRFDLLLFNTYRSYLFPDFYPVFPELRSDNRGHLFEMVRTKSGGQSFASITMPGITRGNHYHVRKFERFMVIEGDALICIRKLLTDETVSFNVSGGQPAFVDIPTLHTHNISNTGESNLITIFWANELFDPERPDTMQEIV